jgi:hypothetical protein
VTRATGSAESRGTRADGGPQRARIVDPAVLPANPTFEGAGVGAKMLITDPCAGTSRLARPWWWGQGHALVVAVLSGRGEAIRADGGSPRTRTPRTLRISPPQPLSSGSRAMIAPSWTPNAPMQLDSWGRIRCPRRSSTCSRKHSGPYSSSTVQSKYSGSNTDRSVNLAHSPLETPFGFTGSSSSV